MTKELLYDKSDLDRARAEGVASANTEHNVALADVKTKLTAATDERKQLVSAFTEVAGADNPRVAVFVEALNDGVAPATAAKFAGKIEAPKAAPAAAASTRTDADVDRLMNANVASVSDNGAEANADPKAARMAELAGSMKSFNSSKGYAVPARG